MIDQKESRQSAEYTKAAVKVTTPIIPHNLGATPEEWFHLDIILGINEDLLPVVANTKATITPKSTVKELGKVPTRYNGRREVSGFVGWPAHHATERQVEQWSAEPDYGICIITREVRGLDVDVTDPALAQEVQAFIANHLGYALPKRWRANSSKFLHPFKLVGEFGKRVIKLGGTNQIEFLMTGEQFVACGTHPSGARIEWEGGLPSDIPELTVEAFDKLCAALQAKFGKSPMTIAPPPGERIKAEHLDIDDPFVQHLTDKGMVWGESRGGVVITCPWDDEHTTGTPGDGSTMYYPKGANGKTDPGFSCLHGHCKGRNFKLAYEATGYEEPVDDFEATVEEAKAAPEPRYKLRNGAFFASLPPLRWRVRGVLPSEGLAGLYGPSGSAKSFLALDMACAIAEGVRWFGCRTTAAPVVYVCLEGEAGLAQRIKAWEIHNGRALPEGVSCIVQPFTMTLTQDLADMAAVIPPGAVVFIDTLNRAAPTADENSSKDMGEILQAAKRLQAVTGGLVVLVHHTGKDASRGMRGHSSLFAALDASVEVSRDGERRFWEVAKSKDGQDGLKHPFKLDIVNLGADDGEALTSCVVNKAAPGDIPRKLTAQQQFGLGAFNRVAVADSAELESWRAEFYKAHTGDNADAKRKAFQRVRKDLIDAGVLTVENDVYTSDPFADFLSGTRDMSGTLAGHVPHTLPN